MATGQLWVTNSLGGYMWSPNLSRVLRTVVQPLVKFRQFADIKDAAVQGKGKGQTFQWNVYSDISQQGAPALAAAGRIAVRASHDGVDRFPAGGDGW